MEIAFILFGVVLMLWLTARGRKNDKNDTPTEETLNKWNTSKRREPTNNRQRPTYPAPKPDTIRKQTVVGPAYVVDGDSLRIQKMEIRLFGVDAPELNHPFGKKAKWELVRLCKGHKVQAEIVTTDTHGRSVAKCSLPDGRDLSAEMVKAGLAIDWPKFSGGRYKNLEVTDARKKMWLADARQKGRMHVWENYAARQKPKSDQNQSNCES